MFGQSAQSSCLSFKSALDAAFPDDQYLAPVVIDEISWIATPAAGAVPRLSFKTNFGPEDNTLEHLQLRLAMVASGPPPDNDAARGPLLRIF